MDNQGNILSKKIAGAAVFNAMSSARKLVIAALILHFFSLFLLYQDATTAPGNTIMWNTGDIVQLQHTIG